MKPSTHNEKFKESEALGHIKTMPEHIETKPQTINEVEVIDDPEAFRMAIAQAQMDGIDHVIVSERVMKYLSRGHNITSLTYGDPGVRVYLVGTKEDTDRKERLTAEQFHEVQTKEFRAKLTERQRSSEKL